jgi:hypothetical protein
MAVVQNLSNEEVKKNLLENCKKTPIEKLSVKNIIPETENVLVDPINSNRVSKIPIKDLTIGSALKAVVVFAGTLGLYNLFKKTNIFSYFVWGEKNSKNLNNSKKMEVKTAKESLSLKVNSEGKRLTNDPVISSHIQMDKNKDSTVKFEEIGVKDFLSKKEDIESRRAVKSIEIKNPIPDQNIIVEESFNLTINGPDVFSSSGGIFLDITNIPDWMSFISLDPNPRIKSSYDTSGLAYDVTVIDDYAYIASGLSGLYIIDIKNPSNPILKGSFDTSAFSMGIDVYGNYAYLATYNGLVIADISDTSSPTFKGLYNEGIWGSNEIGDVVVYGNYAYLASREDDDKTGLHIVDVTNPANPTLAASYDTPGYANGVAIFDNHVYVVDNSADYTVPSSLLIMDIDFPENPVLRGSYNAPNNAVKVTVFGNYAYVADLERGLHVVDITDPLNPIFKSLYNTPGLACGVAIFKDYAYIADRASGLQIIDISDPTNPTFAASCDMPSEALEVAVYENCIYVADKDFGLQIVAFNPSKLVLYGTPPNSLETYKMNIKACNELSECVTDSFDIIVGNNPPIVETQIPDQIMKVNEIFALNANNVFSDLDKLPSFLKFSENYLFGIPTNVTVFPLEVTASDNYNGTVTDKFTLTIQDFLPISINSETEDQKILEKNLLEFEIDTNEIFKNPEHKSIAVDVTRTNNEDLPEWLTFEKLFPALEGSVATSGSTKDLVIKGPFAYLANNDKGLKIVDISNPSGIPEKGTFTTDNAIGIAKSGNLLFLADGTSGLKILDVRDSANPNLIGTYPTEDISNNVEISGKYAYLADGTSGVKILDVSSPNPTLVGSYNVEALDVKVFENYAYIASGIDGFNILDITDKTTPTLKGSYQNAISVNSLTISENYCYLANDNAGLKILDISDKTLPTVVGSFDTIGIAKGVAVSGNEAYVALDTGGIQIIDITDKTNPILKDTIDTTGTALKIDKSGNFLFVADGQSGMKVLNVGRIKFSGTPGENDVGIITIELKANDGTNTVIDTFTIEVEKDAAGDVNNFLTSVAGWLSISLASTASVCLTGASLILLTLVTVCCKKAKAKKK